MREAYGVSAKEIENGFECCCEEFGIKDYPIYGDSHSVYKELKKIIKQRMVFDTKSTYLFRAPYEETLTNLDDADIVFFISFEPEEINIKNTKNGQGI